MTRRANKFAKLGLSMLVVLILVLLTYTSLVLPNKLFVNQHQPYEERLLDSRHLENVLLDKSYNIGKRQSDLQGRPLSQVQVFSDDALAKLQDESERAIQARDKRIAELERQLSQQVKIIEKSTEKPIVIDRANDGIRPLRVTVAHHPRSDLLGSFVLPSIFLLAITYRYGWEMEILPYNESFGQRWLNKAFAKGSKLAGKRGYGTGFQDANYRDDYNPADLNAQAYSNLGFFPHQPFPTANVSEWTVVRPLPAPGSVSLRNACRKNLIEANGHVRCRLILPLGEDTPTLLKHIVTHGTLEDYFTPDFRQLMRDRFMQANAHRLKYYFSNSTTDYNVAIHVRRGEINKKDFPDRWTEQSVYASIARHICKTHPNARIHVFSSGKNEESWATLEQASDSCASVSFHLDEYEFDAWAHFVAADALVTSRSTFSYVPALISGGEIYAPEWGHSPLMNWHSFKNEDGTLKRPTVNVSAS